MNMLIGAAAFMAGIVISAAAVVVAARVHNGGQSPEKKRRAVQLTATTPPVKKRSEFSKRILATYAVSCIAWITADYVLAFMYRQPINTQVTVTLTTTVVAALLGYYAKAAFEKSSRNQYSLDENGVPFGNDGGGA